MMSPCHNYIILHQFIIIIITMHQMNVLKIIIAVLHRLPNGRHVGRHA